MYSQWPSGLSQSKKFASAPHTPNKRRSGKFGSLLFRIDQKDPKALPFNCEGRPIPDPDLQPFITLKPVLWYQRNPIVDPRKLEHGFRRISARIPYTLP